MLIPVPIPLPEEVLQASCCSIFVTDFALQTVSGMGVGANAAARCRLLKRACFFLGDFRLPVGPFLVGRASHFYASLRRATRSSVVATVSSVWIGTCLTKNMHCIYSLPGD